MFSRCRSIISVSQYVSHSLFLSSVQQVLRRTTINTLDSLTKASPPFKDNLNVYVSLINRLTSHYLVSILPLIFWLAPCLHPLPTYYIWLTLPKQLPLFSPTQPRFMYKTSTPPQPIKTHSRPFSNCLLKPKLAILRYPPPSETS